MDKGFSISGHLLSCLQPDDPREARLRMLCVTISKDMPEERRERQLRPFASDMEFMNMIAGWMNGLPEAISHEQPDFERWLELFMTAGEAESTPLCHAFANMVHALLLRKRVTDLMPVATKAL